jgi:hypothetical protein
MFSKIKKLLSQKLPPQKQTSSSIYPSTSMFICHLQLFLTSFLSMSFPPLQLINATPLLTIIRAAFLLYYKSHTPRERPPHAFHARRH